MAGGVFGFGLVLLPLFVAPLLPLPGVAAPEPVLLPGVLEESLLLGDGDELAPDELPAPWFGLSRQPVKPSAVATAAVARRNLSLDGFIFFSVEGGVSVATGAAAARPRTEGRLAVPARQGSLLAVLSPSGGFWSERPSFHHQQTR